MLTVSNPENPEQTYTYGKRGRKPLWVQAGEKEGLWDVPEPKTPQKKGPKKPIRPEGHLRTWKWWGGEGEVSSSLRCYIVANDPVEAVMKSGNYFKYAISGIQLSNLWKEVDDDLSDCFPVDRFGIWSFNEKNLRWEEREPINKCKVSAF